MAWAMAVWMSTVSASAPASVFSKSLKKIHSTSPRCSTSTNWVPIVAHLSTRGRRLPWRVLDSAEPRAPDASMSPRRGPWVHDLELLEEDLPTAQILIGHFLLLGCVLTGHGRTGRRAVLAEGINGRSSDVSDAGPLPPVVQEVREVLRGEGLAGLGEVLQAGHQLVSRHPSPEERLRHWDRGTSRGCVLVDAVPGRPAVDGETESDGRGEAAVHQLGRRRVGQLGGGERRQDVTLVAAILERAIVPGGELGIGTEEANDVRLGVHDRHDVRVEVDGLSRASW